MTKRRIFRAAAVCAAVAAAEGSKGIPGSLGHGLGAATLPKRHFTPGTWRTVGNNTIHIEGYNFDCTNATYTLTDNDAVLNVTRAGQPNAIRWNRGQQQ